MCFKCLSNCDLVKKREAGCSISWQCLLSSCSLMNELDVLGLREREIWVWRDGHKERNIKVDTRRERGRESERETHP